MINSWNIIQTWKGEKNFPDVGCSESNMADLISLKFHDTSSEEWPHLLAVSYKLACRVDSRNACEAIDLLTACEVVGPIKGSA